MQRQRRRRPGRARRSRSRRLLPAVIMLRQSRQARRSSWRGEPAQARPACGAESGALTPRRSRATSVRNTSSRLPPRPARRLQLGERALGDQAAARQHADALGHALGDFEDVRGHDDRAAGADARLQHVLHLPRGAGVEAGQRLVEDDEARVVDQRAGERHLLAHAAREALAALVGVRTEAEPVDQLARRSCRRRPRRSPHRPATNSRYSSGVSLS